jgi:uncharacterized membrane protein (DUF441 family)
LQEFLGEELVPPVEVCVVTNYGSAHVQCFLKGLAVGPLIAAGMVALIVSGLKL